jgi:hypothetical protein|tara:strand:+ start:11376 stop:11711 length:336 start_codon:yes stop_codon:yes gene_type:complete
MRDTENDELAEKDYNAFMVNRGLSYFYDTVIHANEMNHYHELDNKLQYEFLFHGIRKKKRFSKWFKPTEDADFEAVKEYYEYNNHKTLQALSVLSEFQIKIIKNKLEKGGT